MMSNIFCICKNLLLNNVGGRCRKINRYHERSDMNSGQTLVEFIIVYVLLFLCAFAVVEIERIIAFKNCLQASTSYIAHKIAYSQIDLLKNHKITDQTGIYENDNKQFSKKISTEIESYLNKISTTFFSYDNNENAANEAGVRYIKKHDVRVYLKLANNSKSLPSGIYIESQTCLPVLFSSYFRHFKEKFEVGKSLQDDTDSRTCLGHFNASSRIPLYWFKIQVFAYSPWPAATQIFKHGLALPDKFEALEQENRKDVLAAIDALPLTQFFNSTLNKG
jgi:hypothetical protein